MEHLDRKRMKRRMYGMKNQLPSRLVVNIMKSGIYHAAGFPPSIQCNELMVECARHYDPQFRTIKTPKGLVLAYLAEESKREVFRIPSHREMRVRTKEDAQKLCSRKDSKHV